MVAALDVGADVIALASYPSSLMLPLCGTLMDIDRVQAFHNLHATLSPVITTLDYHECAASTYPLRIGMGFAAGTPEGLRAYQEGWLLSVESYSTEEVGRAALV